MLTNSNFNKIKSEYENSIRIYSKLNYYYFKSICITLSEGLYPNNDIYHIGVHNYRPCKKCGNYSDIYHSSSYVYTSDPIYLREYNMDANCKICEKFISLITGRNIFSKDIINSKKKFHKYSKRFIRILLCRYTTK